MIGGGGTLVRVAGGAVASPLSKAVGRETLPLQDVAMRAAPREGLLPLVLYVLVAVAGGGSDGGPGGRPGRRVPRGSVLTRHWR